MRRSFSQHVRDGCAAVAASAEWVHIRADRIATYAASLPIQTVTTPALDPAVHYSGTPEATAAFVLQLDSINFGSGYFPHLAKLPGHSGYFTIAAHLTNRFRNHSPLRARDLVGLTAADCAEIFHQDLENPPAMELMWLFATAFSDLGRYVERRFGGSFARLVASACGSSQRLVGILSGMRLFRDVFTCRGVDVPFYKRAQLCAADLALAFEGKPLGAFRDLAELTIFADNLVPHVLRADGILEYHADLARRIDEGTLIASGSVEEVEIRASAVHACELICSELRQRGAPATAMQLDYFLWNRGQRPEYKARPRHRTRSIFY